MTLTAEAKPVLEFEPDFLVLDYTEEFIEPSMILGRLEGPTRTHSDGEIASGEEVLYLREPRHTEYILIQRSDGQLEVCRWDAALHPPLDDITPIGGAISDFMEQIEGMTEMTEPLGFRFRQVQRAQGTAMHTYDSIDTQVRRRGGKPDYPLDKSGGRALQDNGFRILFPAANFAYDASRHEINRILPEDESA